MRKLESEERPDSREGARREPALNLPLPVTALLAALLGAHLWRVLAHVGPGRWAVAWGSWASLVGSLFVHASWAHVLLNSAACLAFGPPVARVLGSRARGFGLFFAFFLLCGVISGGLFLLIVGPGGVGASGAASGLLGGTMRLQPGESRPGPLLTRRTIGATAAWAVANAILGLTGLTPGAGGLPVAWQAHIFGFLAGLLLIGLFARLARPRLEET